MTPRTVTIINPADADIGPRRVVHRSPEQAGQYWGQLYAGADQFTGADDDGSGEGHDPAGAA